MARIIVKDGIEFKDLKITRHIFSEHRIFLSLFGEVVWYLETQSKEYDYPLLSIILYENILSNPFDNDYYFIMSFDISSKLHNFSLLYQYKGPFFKKYPFDKFRIATPFLEMTTQEEKELKEVLSIKNLEYLGGANFEHYFVRRNNY